MKRRYSFLVLVAVFAVLAASSARAEEPPAVGTPAPVCVRLLLEKRTFILGEERFPVELEATNVGAEVVEIAVWPLGESDQTVHFEVQDRKGEPVEYVGGATFPVLGEDYKKVPRGERVSLSKNLASFYRIDQPGRYRVRGSATVDGARFYSDWQEFEVVLGREVYREDLEIVKPRPYGPDREKVALVVYAVGDRHVAFFRREFQKDGEAVVRYRRLLEIDPAVAPQVLVDPRGEMHVLLKHRPLPKEEIEERFKKYPHSYEKYSKYDFWDWYVTDPNDGSLDQERHTYVLKEENATFRLVEVPGEKIELHKFSADGEDLTRAAWLRKLILEARENAERIGAKARKAALEGNEELKAQLEGMAASERERAAELEKKLRRE